MAKFFRNKKGIGYLTLGFFDLVNYSRNPDPICDECLSLLAESSKIVLIPILNEAFCEHCYKERLDDVVDYPGDRTIRKKREEFCKDFFQLKE
ncbi:MAG: hypothetical protein RSG53_07790 [Oscillospiraceae bacterium]